MREGEKPYLEYSDGEIIPKAMPNLDHGDLVHFADVEVGVYGQTRTVELFEPGQEGTRLGELDTLRSGVLPGFELPLGALFAVLDG